MESNVTVISRSKDTSVVQKAADGAKKQYVEISGWGVNINITGDLSDTLYNHFPIIYNSSEMWHKCCR